MGGSGIRSWLVWLFVLVRGSVHSVVLRDGIQKCSDYNQNCNECMQSQDPDCAFLVYLREEEDDDTLCANLTELFDYVGKDKGTNFEIIHNCSEYFDETLNSTSLSSATTAPISASTPTISAPSSGATTSTTSPTSPSATMKASTAKLKVLPNTFNSWNFLGGTVLGLVLYSVIYCGVQYYKSNRNGIPLLYRGLTDHCVGNRYGS